MTIDDSLTFLYPSKAHDLVLTVDIKLALATANQPLSTPIESRLCRNSFCALDAKQDRTIKYAAYMPKNGKTTLTREVVSSIVVTIVQRVLESKRKDPNAYTCKGTVSLE